jgi:predicted ATPase/DNA-binding CsgD family transcriptional regulator
MAIDSFARHPRRSPVPLRPVAAREIAGILPTPLSTLIGREREVAVVAALVRDPAVRLVTLTGPGGVGKTRLALRAATEVADGFADGVAFVELSAVRDPDLVLPAIAQALRVRAHGNQPVAAALQAVLRARDVLLVLDNFEPVVTAGPQLSELLRACPRLTALVTTRVLLEVNGERAVPVPPLSLPRRREETIERGADDAPPAGLRSPAESVLASEAVRLFVARTRDVQPEFALTEENAATVAEICRRLDGLPLAIELAAARTRTLPPAALLARLERRLPLLTGGPRDQPERLRTMREAIAWSYDPLSPEEQTLFRRLGVFVGGFTLDAAEVVGSDGQTGRRAGGQNDDATALSACPSARLSVSVLDLVASLVDQSLVHRTVGADGEPRFAMLETIREFARDRLADSGEAEEIPRRHAACFLDLAERADRALTGPEQRLWLTRLEVDHGNLRAALGWALAEADATFGLRLASALARFWVTHGHVKEGRDWLRRMLALPDTDGSDVAIAVRANALARAGWLAHCHDDYAAAAQLLEESLALYRPLGQSEHLADRLMNQGMMARAEGDYGQAVWFFQQCIDLYREVGDRGGVGRSLYRLAHVVREQGETDRARTLSQECLTQFRASGDRSGEAAAQLSLCDVARDVGDGIAVRAHCTESLRLFRELGEPWGTGFSLYNLGMAAYGDGDLEQALALVNESLVVFRELDNASCVAEALLGLARITCARGQVEDANGMFLESLDVTWRVGPRILVAAGLEGLAHVRALAGDGHRAARLAGAAAALRTGIGAPLPPSARADGAVATSQARAAIGGPSYLAAWDEGRALPLSDAIAEALSSPVPLSVAGTGRPSTPAVRLTDREGEVLRLLAAGFTDRQIADALFLSPRTVHRHVGRLYDKLDVHTRTAAVAAAQAAGLLDGGASPSRG